MHVKTIDLNGNYRYFDKNGYEVKIIRETGRHEGRIPDYAFGFLTPGIEAKRPEITKENKRILTNQKKIADKLFSKRFFWSKIVAWFKSLFSNGKQ
jgi:hypothetical protein